MNFYDKRKTMQNQYVDVLFIASISRIQVNNKNRIIHMKPRIIREGIQWIGFVDWNRRLFDSLIPLPDGTSYNAYLIQGSDKTALIDAVDPAIAET